MKTVNFYPKTFHEIPKQDNPAFGDERCMMIVKGDDIILGPNVKVLKALGVIPSIMKAVNRVALFWNENDAVEYCDWVCSRVKEGGDRE